MNSINLQIDWLQKPVGITNSREYIEALTLDNPLVIPPISDVITFKYLDLGQNLNFLFFYENIIDKNYVMMNTDNGTKIHGFSIGEQMTNSVKKVTDNDNIYNLLSGLRHAENEMQIFYSFEDYTSWVEGEKHLFTFDYISSLSSLDNGCESFINWKFVKGSVYQKINNITETMTLLDFLQEP